MAECAKALEGTVPDNAFDVAVERLSRESLRSRRKREVRAMTISTKRMTKRELQAGRLLYPDVPHWRPATRGDCDQVERPCPFVSCRYHLFVDVSPTTGAIKMNFPDLEPDELTETCSLDIADQGGATLEEVGVLLNLTRERIRQVEVKAFGRVDALNSAELAEHADGDRNQVRVHQQEHR